VFAACSRLTIERDRPILAGRHALGSPSNRSPSDGFRPWRSGHETVRRASAAPRGGANALSVGLTLNRCGQECLGGRHGRSGDPWPLRQRLAGTVAFHSHPSENFMANNGRRARFAEPLDRGRASQGDVRPATPGAAVPFLDLRLAVDVRLLPATGIPNGPRSQRWSLPPLAARVDPQRRSSSLVGRQPDLPPRPRHAPGHYQSDPVDSRPPVDPAPPAQACATAQPRQRAAQP